MQLRILGEGLRPSRVAADSLVVFADDGVTPLAVVVRHSGDAHYVATCDDPHFNAVLRNMGVDAVTVVESPTPTLAGVPATNGALSRR